MSKVAKIHLTVTMCVEATANVYSFKDDLEAIHFFSIRALIPLARYYANNKNYALITINPFVDESPCGLLKKMRIGNCIFLG